MRQRWRRTTLAAAVAAIAFGVPCVAWYAAGRAAARQEADRLRSLPRSEARATASRMAQRLAVRLEALRHSEARRATSDYHVHDTDTDECRCAEQGPSPLAEGPADPLVWTHFEIDDVGKITLPNFDPDRPSDPRALAALTDERAIVDVLECAGSARLGGAASGDVSDLRWNTVSLEGASALVAVRTVRTRGVEHIQGFVVRSDALRTLLEGEETAAAVSSGSAPDAPSASIPIEGPEWYVSVDASRAEQRAAGEAAGVLRRFRRSFGLGFAGVALLALMLVGTVAQAERLARERSRFAAAAAHELRTPLAGLRLYGDMLATDAGDPERAARHAARISGEAERLGRVVTNLLGFARLERGELRTDVRDGDLGVAVTTAVERLRPGVESRGARIELAVPSSCPARFDGDAVHQIVQNLLDNAERFSRNAEDRRIGVALERRRDRALLSVTDRGSGIDAKLAERVFKPFEHASTSERHEGLGLGLALVRALVRAQGGEVVHEPVDGGGTRFTVSFRTAGDAGAC